MLRPCQLVSLLGTVFLLLGEVGHDDDDKQYEKNDDDEKMKKIVQVRGLGDAVYAVNCGGEAHTDLFGIKVQQENNSKVDSQMR